MISSLDLHQTTPEPELGGPLSVQRLRESRTLNIGSIADCKRRLKAIDRRQARQQHLIPITVPLHPDRDRHMILSIAQDMAKGAIGFALVACAFPQQFLSNAQRRKGGVYGVEVWRSLHRGSACTAAK